MNGIVLCVLAFLSCFLVTLVGRVYGLVAMIVWGYFFGILKAHYNASFGLFIFDFATIGFYLGIISKFPPLILRQRYSRVKMWVTLLIAWPVFMAVIPMQHYIVQIVGLRGNVFWIPMILAGCLLEGKDKTILAYSLACMNVVAFGFALAEFFIGVDAFVPDNEVTQIVHLSADMVGGAKRIPSTFANAHSYALFMVATIPWILGEIVGQWRLSFSKMTGMTILLPGFVCALLGIFIAGPRQPVVCLGLVIALAVMTGRINTGLILIGLVGGLVVAYFVAQEERMQRFTQLQDFEMVQKRIGMSVNMSFLEVLLDYPMGNGIGAGGTSLPGFAQGLVERSIVLENEYSRILLEQGLPGFFIFLAFLFWFILNKVAKDDPEYMTKSLIWIHSIVTISTAFIGLGMMSTIPASATLMLGIGYCLSPSEKSAILIRSRLRSWNRADSCLLPAYQRGLARA
jgi:hypothetical protein